MEIAEVRLSNVWIGLWIGYLTLVPNTELTYFTSTAYASAVARGVRYNDLAFAIAWPAKAEVVPTADRSSPILVG
jgi:dTDP-4-dehydrorhamnose 3,5-epimerase